MQELSCGAPSSGTYVEGFRENKLAPDGWAIFKYVILYLLDLETEANEQPNKQINKNLFSKVQEGYIMY